MSSAFQAICVDCGKQEHATNLVDNGGKLLPQHHTQTMNQHGWIVNAVCWRCRRERLVRKAQPERTR